MTIPVPQRINNKLTEEFYPLQREELIKLREVKLINNAAYVHLALRSENPFCDRPVQIIPKEFALRWRIPEVSVYKAIAKLKELGILNIKSGKLVIDWVMPESKESKEDTEKDAEKIIKSDKPVPDSNYQIEEKIIRSDNELSDPKTDYQIRENYGLKSLSDIAYSIPQTLQKIQTNQTRGGEEKKSNQEAVQKIVLKSEVKEEVTSDKSNESVREFPRAVTQKKTNIISPSKKSADIPNELIEKLEELEIPLDKQVKAAIASHHVSQAYGACAHCENTRESITNVRSVFLYQLPKQPVETLGSRYSEEMLNNLKAQNEAIEEERSDPEYQQKSKDAFAQIRAKLKGKRAQ
jgi:phosphate uptake regulator